MPDISKFSRASLPAWLAVFAVVLAAVVASAVTASVTDDSEEVDRLEDQFSSRTVELVEAEGRIDLLEEKLAAALRERSEPDPEPTEPPDVEPEPEPEPAPASSALASFEGSGIESTRPFSVSGPWELRWRATGSIFQIYVYEGNSRVPYDVAANQQCPCRGKDYQPQGGRFYLDINTDGDWAVAIVEA